MKKLTFNFIIIASVILLTVFTFNFKTTNVSEKSPLEKYSQVKVFITNQGDIQMLQNRDITVEHFTGNLKEGITLVINQEEIARLQSTGIRYNIEIPDLDEYYLHRPSPTESDMMQSELIKTRDNAAGFSYGSMGGYYTYAEVVQKLDSMRLQYPTLITAKQNRGTTHQARTIWSVKISDNADVNESATEPAIYFDALHHAREPQAMASTMYFMYWLLDNYAANPEARYLVDNREIYFVPVANPDGYVYNQTTNPNGGGSWRKNRRNNGSCFGVDQNRNYNYGWGNNNGSSNDPCSDTYRGPSAASEPETQAIKNLCLSINPKIGFSNHSVAGRYLNPYGYNDTAIAFDIYSEFSSDFSSHNDYLYGTVIEMLQYYSSGTTRDWLHHDLNCYAWTPEAGGSGFWPNINEIIPIASENITGFKYLSWVGGAYANFQNFSILGNGYVQRNDTLNLQIGIKNKGLSKTSKNVVVDVSTSYANITPLVSSVSYDSIPARQIKYNSATPFRFRLTNTANYMDEIKLIVTVKQENVISNIDTIYVTSGKTTTLFFDNAESGTSRWTKSGNQTQWDTSFCDYFTEGHSFADSRYGNSKNNTNNYFTLNDSINLIGAVNPRLEFFTKSASELNYDYTRVQVSTNFGTSWTNIAGRYTTTLSGQPSYHGNRSWVHEQFNLNSFIGQRIKIRFNYFTDGGVPGDGFYFDNFRVVDYTNTVIGIINIGGNIPTRFALSQNYPNPFNPKTIINYELPITNYVSLKVYDVLGKEVVTLVNEKQNAGTYEVDFDGSNFPSGVYYYKLVATDYTETKKMILIK